MPLRSATRMNYFEYGERELSYLKEKDKTLGGVIERIGPVYREIIPDLYAALVAQIVSQQISTKAAVTIWQRLNGAISPLDADTVDRTDATVIQQCGMSMRKALYIKELSRKVCNGELDLEKLHDMSDADVCAQLSSLRGIGMWTAEMLMTFSMQRPDVMSWDDLAIHRGLRMLYRHRRITRKLFDKYRRRYSPYASVACLYLWAIAGGECGGMTDPAPLTAAQKKARARKRMERSKAAKRQPRAADG